MTIATINRIQLIVTSKFKHVIKPSTSKLDYNKANWTGFENDLNIQHPTSNVSIDELNRIIVTELNVA